MLMKNEQTAITALAEKEPLTTYHERELDGKLYRITSVYMGKIDLRKALEDLTVRKILQSESDSAERI